MSIKDSFEVAKPYITGGVAGAVLAVIVGFSAGWVVTAGTHATEVQSARVAAFATVCADRSLALWASEGRVVAELKGWENRQQREELAARVFSADTAADIRNRILSECERAINRSA